MIMPEPPNAMDWEGRTLLDRSGDKIGTIEEIFLVEETGRPEWALVKLGLLNNRARLVPLVGANPIAEGIRAAYEKSVVNDAPPIDGDREPTEQQVAALYRHYGIDASPTGAATDSANGLGATQHNGSAQAGRTEVLSGSSDLRGEPISDLVKQVSDEAKSLLQQEFTLAKVEMTEKAKQVGIAGGMLGAAGYMSHLAALGLMLTLIFALATFMPAWGAALIVTVLFVAGAATLALAGKKRMKKAGPPVPEETIESVKQTIETVKEEAKWGLGQTR
jgi:uncharacterized membrane protein YqjE